MDNLGQSAKKAPPHPQSPLPGFTRTALLVNLRTFFILPNLTGIFFILATVIFPFFIGNIDLTIPMPGFHLMLPIGWITIIICLGCRLWYYFEIIWASYLEMNTLPDIEIGFGFEFIENIIRSIYFNLVALLLSALPFVFIMTALEKIGLNQLWLRIALLLPAAIFYPMFLLMFAIGIEPWKAFRLDQIFRILIRFPKPYLLMTVVTFLALIANWLTIGFLDFKKNPTLIYILLKLTARITTAFLSVLSMRTIGIFGRHYARSIPFLWIND